MKLACRPAFLGILVTLILVVFVSLPYVYAFQSASPNYVFGGFLLNPLDGNTYLAKLYQGWRGDWRFTLPYVAEPGQGGYVYMFYIILGNLARWTGISTLWMYHLARMVGAVLLAVALYRFLICPLDARARPFAIFVLALFGSGLGWLAFPFGAFTSDFWVAEAYPFLSAYANPHFVLGLVLLLWLLDRAISPSPRQGALILLSLLLALVNPFCIVIALLALGGLAAWDFWLLWRSPGSVPQLAAKPGLISRLPASFSPLLWTFVGAAPLLLYTFWIMNTDPVFSGWNAQNLTPSPPLWDLLLSLSPVLLLAAAGAWLAFKRSERRARLMAAWLVLDLLLLYLPLDLQRRLMTGLFIPVVGLAGIGIENWMQTDQRRARLALTATLVLALPTNLIVLLAAFSGIQSHNSLLYLQRSEAQALVWIEQNTPPHALILAAPDTGLWIPAHTGRRVIYGHPFETVNAEQEKAVLTQFFNGALPDAAGFLAERRVDYIFYGPREQALGELPSLSGWQTVYQADGVTIYALGGD